MARDCARVPNMAQQGRKRSDHNLVLALACGSTVENAARQAGVSPATVYKRLREPVFQAQLESIRREMVERTTSMLTAASGESVKTLLRLQRENVPHSVQLGAAKAVVEFGVEDARQRGSLRSHCFD